MGPGLGEWSGHSKAWGSTASGSSDPYSCSSQRLKSEACWGLGALDPALSMSPQLPKASPNPALHTSLRDGQRRGAVLIR